MPWTDPRDEENAKLRAEAGKLRTQWEVVDAKLQAALLQIDELKKEFLRVHTCEDGKCWRCKGGILLERVLGKTENPVGEAPGHIYGSCSISPCPICAKLNAEFTEKRVVSSPKEAEKVVQDIYPTLKALSDNERKIAFDGLWGMFCRTCYRLLDEGRKCHCWNDE